MQIIRLPLIASLLIALIAGSASVLAFAPFGWWPVQILALATLFLLSMRASDVRSSFALGWAYSFGLIGTGTHWLYISLHTYGGMPALLTIAALMLLAAALAVLYGAALAIAKKYASESSSVTALLLIPACWMLADWTRGWIFTGFSWLATGYAHTASPLSAYAALIGVYGISWLAALLASCIALMVFAHQLHKLGLALLILIPAAGLMLSRVEWTTPVGAPVSVRLLQGNVAQDMKFSESHLAASLALYRRMMLEKPADLIVTPETALPVLASQLPKGYLDELAAFGRSTGSQLLIGLPWTTAPGIYLNSLLGIGQENSTIYRYDKHHLVPFGEFIPPGARWFIDLMHIPLGDFGRGDLEQAAFPVKDQWVLPNICYEDLFGEEIAAQLSAAMDRGAPIPSILLNVSNIAWFDDSIALPQHLQISQMRTLETGRPMLRATNTGATAAIDGRGKVSALLPAFTEGTLSVSVQGMRGSTPYIRLGNSLPVTLALLIVFSLWRNSRRRLKNS